MNEISEVLKGAGKVIESIPDVYDDSIKNTVQESGKTLALIPKTINAALVPLRKWIVEREFNFAETEKILAIKLEKIEESKIITPEAYVAVPALNAISYSLDSEELRNLYANLLAKSMNIDTKEFVHPSFVEIIRQLSPVDAHVFRLIYEEEVTPLIDLSISMESGGSNNQIYNLSWITLYSYELVSISIDNLLRLGLIEIPYGVNYTMKEHYSVVRCTDSYIEKKALLEALNLGKVHENEKYIKKTTLATSFYRICVLD